MNKNLIRSVAVHGFAGRIAAGHIVAVGHIAAAEYIVAVEHNSVEQG